MRRDVVVIGASAGGIQALEGLLRGLPASLPASVFVTLHIPERGGSLLPEILQRDCALPVHRAVDGEAIEPGRVYVAGPGAHLLLEAQRVRLGFGPPENGHRPAIDAMFRSAAYVFRRRVIGVILSGNLDDGTAGFWAIKRRGGLTMVQDPDEAQHPSMIRSALEYVQVDRTAKVAALGALISRLSNESLSETAAMNEPEPRLGQEVALATDPTQRNELQQPYGEDAPAAGLSCPSCHGTLWEIREGALTRYRCRVGHAFSSEVLMAEQQESLEEALWAACRSLEENAALNERLSLRAQQANNLHAHRHFVERVRRTTEQAALIRKLLLTSSQADEAELGHEATRKAESP